MKVKPLYDRVLIRRIDQKEQVKGGIIIPDSAKEKPQQGEIVAAGGGKVLEDGKVLPLDVKVGDRVLFGKYSFAPSEYPYYWRTLETADEYFDYYRDYHAFWKLYGLALPDEVLRKVYYQNAVRLIPNLPRAALPN